MNRELRYTQHSQTIGNWVEKSTRALSKAEKIDLFEKSLLKIVSKCQTSLSEITLGAVLDRVLYNSSEQYPLLLSIHLKGVLLDFDHIRNHLDPVTDSEVNEAFHYLITELFFIIGNITAEQLTPLLLAELRTEKKVSE